MRTLRQLLVILLVIAGALLLMYLTKDIGRPRNNFTSQTKRTNENNLPQPVLEIELRDLIAEASQHHNRKVKVGPLGAWWNDLERQSFRGAEIADVAYGRLRYNYHVDIEIFYKNLPDVYEWRRYDSAKKAIVVEGTFFLYTNRKNAGYINAEKITVVAIDDLTSDALP